MGFECSLSGNLPHCVTTYTVKMFLTLRQNFPCFDIHLLCLVPPMCISTSGSVFAQGRPPIQLLSSWLISLTYLILSSYLVCHFLGIPLLDLLQRINTLLAQGRPKLDTALQMRSHKCKIEGKLSPHSC